jgi:hypothetical protein
MALACIPISKLHWKWNESKEIWVESVIADLVAQWNLN